MRQWIRVREFGRGSMWSNLAFAKYIRCVMNAGPVSTPCRVIPDRVPSPNLAVPITAGLREEYRSLELP